ncbi:MAG TPA: 3-isopropylmalate dehydratase small subunit [Fimbriimonadaceae bacterium]|nr:3-isopropylmalate dehydratase small subunit [Fimbriimonadaceae bacterium]HRJ96752.1 3-isopropylmalate dehydratase small subunit [Fimbriimonadaceae bacterium]
MAGFDKLTGKIAIYNDDNVDTDRIIPARFLSMVSKAGYGELAFKDVRGADFPLDHPDAAGAEILVVGTNFGCGSSREHAVWALQQAGYRAIIGRRTATSPGFSDIFRQNAANCGLLLVELDEEAHRHLVEAGIGAEATVDLPHQHISVHGRGLPFEIDSATKAQMMAGLDLIGTTLIYSDQISQFEGRSTAFVPPR